MTTAPRWRSAAVLSAALLSFGLAGCAGPASPETAPACGTPSPGPGDRVAAQCDDGQRFELAGTDAMVTDRATVTVDDTGAVEFTLTLSEPAASDITARLHIEDPYQDHREVFATDPTSGADCLGDAGACALSWDFTESGYAIDVSLGYAPQMWVGLDDGTDETVIWFVRATVD